jgi:hypothetical protein
MHSRSILAGLLLLPLLGACIGNTGPDGGTYRATVTGAVDTTLTGRAVLERGAGRDEFKYAVHMFLPGRGPEFGIFLFFPEQPRQGIYAVVNRGAPSLKRGEVSAGAMLGTGFVATSGEVRITSQNPTRGTFDLVEQWGTAATRIRGDFSIP